MKNESSNKHDKQTLNVVKNSIQLLKNKTIQDDS